MEVEIRIVDPVRRVEPNGLFHSLLIVWRTSQLLLAYQDLRCHTSSTKS